MRKLTITMGTKRVVYLADRTSELISQHSSLEPLLDKIGGYRAQFISCLIRSKQAADGAIFHSDFIVEAVAQRGLDLSEAFLMLVVERQYLPATSLIRQQLDSLIRVYYLSSLKKKEEIEKIVSAIIRGDPLDKLKDEASGQKLKDKYLLEVAGETYPRIKEVYTEVSGFIHFSRYHVKATISRMEENGKYEQFFGIGTPHLPLEDITKLLMLYCDITDKLLMLLEGWIVWKDSTVRANDPK